MYLIPSIKNKFIFGDSKRIFLNLELGCRSSCKYCYLPTEGLILGEKPSATNSISPDDLISILEQDSRFIVGANGTLISIGCYSECWDTLNKDKTIQLILRLLKYKNRIQLATKRKISVNDLKKLTNSQNWENQLIVYISSATISNWSEYESGTTMPRKRFNSFDACNQLNIKSCLYIKPVLDNITIIDADRYGEIMTRYKVSAVVGDIFTTIESKNISPISHDLYIAPQDDTQRLRTRLSVFGQVFQTSTEHFFSIKEGE